MKNETQPTPNSVSITLNGKKLEVPKGTTLIQAALDSGTFIPHYCYHQDLSIAGVCRMCVVEVEKNPKLQIACNTPCAEGMVVHSETPKVKDAVKSALELHLINHPLDCPICDKAGECKLQDYYQEYGLYESRMEYDDKVHKPKVKDIGTIVLDAERCILCTRCVRFTAEVTKTNELCIVNRGDRSELKTYDDKPLRNDYTGNLADVCPVGALTAKDFRFQQRVWFLDKTKTVCTQCSTGCNTTVSYNPSTKKLYRVEPRRNPEVNSSWICDNGRWGYHYLTNESRLKTPKRKGESGWEEFPWEFYFKEAKETIQSEKNSTLVALSTQLTNEEVLDLVLTFKDLGVTHFTWVVDEKTVGGKEPFDGILKRHDQTGNSAGFQNVLDLTKTTWKKWDEVSFDKLTSVFVLGVEGEMIGWVKTFLRKIPVSARLWMHATNWVEEFERAHWVVPNTSAYEKSGTVVNALGKLQKLAAAVPQQYTARNAHQLIYGINQGNDRSTPASNRMVELFDAYVRPQWKVEDTWKRFQSMPSPVVAQGGI